MQKTDAWLTSNKKPATVSGVASAYSTPSMKTELTSRDGTMLLSQINFRQMAFATQTQKDIVKIREYFENRPAGLQVYVTGDTGVAKDLNETINQSVARMTVATIILVVLLLVLIYRSPIAPIVPLVTIGVAYLVSTCILGFLAQGGWKISTARAAFKVVRMIKTMGPALALAIGVPLLAGLTLTPALLAILGDKLFWPFHARIYGVVKERHIASHKTGLAGSPVPRQRRGGSELPKTRRGKQRRQDLVEAAGKVFSERGFVLSLQDSLGKGVREVCG